jgi:hypothetical protein
VATRRNKKRHAGHNGADEEFLHDHVRGDDRVGLLTEPRARSSAGNPAKNSFRRSLNRWHWHLAAGPVAPKTACSSSQLASLAGTTEIAGSVAVTQSRPGTGDG